MATVHTTQPKPEILPMEPEAETNTQALTRPRRARALQKIDRPDVPAGVPPTDMEVFAKLAIDPNVDLTKLEKLIAMKERMDAAKSKAEFDADFALMQGELPEIDEQGRIEIEGQKARAYARFDDIMRAVRPIMKTYGFALSFRERTSPDGKMELVGILSHRAGHREEDRFVTAPDDGGRMNTIQRRGSARSYGQRYLTIFLLNISTREPGFSDDDGEASEKPEAPRGYENFVLDLETLAGDGSKGIGKAYKAAKQEYRAYAEKHDRVRWKSIRAKAKQADARQGAEA